MDYKNKHKEEIIRATQLWECGDITRENLEYIFPELAESEDEKVRKELIQFIKNWKDPNNIGRPHDFPTLTRNVEQCDRYIAWLEKQGEKAKIEEIRGNEGKISPNWTEGDDEMLDKIIAALMGAENVECADYNIMYNWLNSIEQRIKEQQ